MDFNFEPLIKKIKESDSFAIYGHVNPDGDSVGAMLSMLYILKNHFGKEKASIFTRDELPMFMRFLPGREAVKNCVPADEARADLAILVDCGSAKRIGDELAGHLANAASVAVIDHHQSNSGYGEFNYTNPEASSTCEVIFRFTEAAGITIDETLATYLYTGVMYDTGRFMHSNTTPEVFNVCAQLVARGAKPAYIAEKVFNNRSVSHIRLLGYVLENFRSIDNGAIAYMSVSDRDMKRLNATQEDNEGVVEAMGNYEGCEAHILFSELPNGKVRVSMRSCGRMSVGEICEKFGGGGHKFAAGIRFTEPLSAVVEKVVEETRARLRSLHGG